MDSSVWCLASGSTAHMEAQADAVVSEPSFAEYASNTIAISGVAREEGAVLQIAVPSCHLNAHGRPARGVHSSTCSGAIERATVRSDTWALGKRSSVADMLAEPTPARGGGTSANVNACTRESREGFGRSGGRAVALAPPPPPG